MATSGTELIVPKLGESITEAVVAKWLKKVGEPIAMDEPVVDLETDKVNVTLPAPAAGVLSEQRVPAGTTVNVGDVIGSIAAGGAQVAAAAAAAPKPAAPAPSAPAAAAPSPAPIAAPASAPVAIAAATNDVAQTQGRTLPPSQRRALREHDGDVAPVTAFPAPATRPAAPPVPVVAGPNEEVVPMTPLRKTIAERLVAAQHTAAILTTFNEVDMTNVMELRVRYQDQFVAKYGIKLGMMSFFVRACVEGLKEFPGLNAEVRGTSIVYKKHWDIGVAVGGGKGLVVPVVRDADRLGFAEVELRIAELAKKAKDNKLTLDELAGGTFSITNGGVYGSLLSTPLINMPQTGILGMHNIVKRPIAVGDEIQIRPMMYVALSYDHRVVDGREAVQFLIGVKQRVENPERLLFAV